MPSPAETSTSSESQPKLGHVNLMVDTLIANASLNDLQAIVRRTLASSEPAVASAFTASARQCMLKSGGATASVDPNSLFVQDPNTAQWVPSAALDDVLRRTRTLYGAGLALASLRILITVVRGASLTRWEEDSELEQRLAQIDGDLAQAIVSAGQELDAGRIADASEATDIRKALTDALDECQAAVEAWGGDFPFEMAVMSVGQWKTDRVLAR